MKKFHVPIRGRKSLLGRMLTANILAAAVKAIALAMLFLVSSRVEFKEQQMRRAEMMAQFTARMSAIPALVDDRQAMQTIATNALRSEDVLSVRIECRGCPRDVVAIRPATEAASESKFHLLGDSWVEAGEDLRPSGDGSLDWAGLSAHLPDSVGHVRLRLSLAKQEALFRHTAGQALGVLCAILFLTVGVQFFNIRKILRPLAKLTLFTRRVGTGDLASRAPVDRVDEIADLAIAFNQMLDRLSLTTVSRDYVDNIIHSMSECLLVVDFTGHIRTANEAALGLLGYAPAELAGRHVATIVAGETQHLMGAISSVELEWRTKEGLSVPVLFSSAALRPGHGAEEGLVWIAQDITEQKRVSAELIAAQERYALAAAGANDGIWDWNVLTGEIYYSPRWKSMLGYREGEVPNTLAAGSALVHPEDRSRVEAEMETHRIGASAAFESEYRMLHADGRYRWMLCRGLAVRDSSGMATRVAGSLTDITQNKASDPLTGLPNRVLFTERLASVFDRRSRDRGYGFAVLFLDLDRFKMINDSLGHLAGDQLLLGIAARLREGVSAEIGCTETTVARLSGDEFAVLAEGFAGEDAPAIGSRLGARLLRGLSQPFFIEGREVFSSASIGVAPGIADYTAPAEILRDADTAMYRAKALGRSRCAVFDARMRAQAIVKLELDTDLRKAVERREFEVYYQPKFTLSDERLKGFEALVRWRHPQRGLIPPGEFIPAAEETGLILPIGEMVLREACRQMHDWQTRYPLYASLKLSVNLSPRQFVEPDLAALVAGVLSETGLNPSTLSLEVTESVLIGDHESVREKLQSLKELGIELEIDDFGTGYSSLSYLHRFPFDVVKIDRSFVVNVENEEGAAMVRAIVDLAHNLGMAVIAEGVETGRQLQILKETGCQTGQGFYYSRPVPADVAEAVLASAPGASFQSDLAVLSTCLGVETAVEELVASR